MIFWVVLASGRYPGVGLHEMRTQWTLADVLDARDMALWLGECDRLEHEAARAKARQR